MEKKLIEDWFDIYDQDHLAAYTHLMKTGMWPQGFLPDFVECSQNWQIALLGKFRDGFLEMQRRHSNV